MDLLSSVLALVKVKASWSGRFEWGRNWCLQFDPYPGIQSYAVLHGECWLSVEGTSEVVHGKAGDCIVLLSGRPFRVGSNLNLPGLDVAEVRAGTADAALMRAYCGDTFIGIGAQFTLEQDSSVLLTGAFPPLLHIRRQKDRALLRWTLHQLADELEEQSPGSTLVVQQLTTMLLVQALRVYLTTKPGVGASWLRALADRRMRAALSAMHSQPGRRWTLDSLAKVAGCRAPASPCNSSRWSAGLPWTTLPNGACC